MAIKEFVRKLTKVARGTSYSLTVPMEVVKKWKWKERQKLSITVDETRKRLIIKDWKK